MTMLDHARALASGGLSIIPIRPQSKASSVKWEPFQEHIATDDELVRMFSDGAGGIAAICGPISGGLELIDFDVPDKPGSSNPPAWQPFCELLIGNGHQELLRRLIVVKTPSGGRHVVYRSSGAVDGNQKLAERADRRVLIETRGRGGYFLIPPTAGYVLERGSFEMIPEITESERETLLIAARLQNEHYDRVRHERNHPGCERPGDDYNLRGPDIDGLLSAHGWRACGDHGQWRNYTRPGKDQGISAGVSKTTGNFHVFTTSTQFDAGKGYSKFSVYSILEHRGDFFYAAKALKAEGYGSGKFGPDGGPTCKTTVPLSDEESDELWGTGDEFDEIPIEWFWDKRIPLGAISMIQGDPGVGKSTITMALAATASAGGTLPCGQKLDPCHVVMFCCEDDPSRVVVPRLKAMGANVKNISLVATDRKRADGTPVFDGTITVDMLFARVRKMGARMLVIDPLIESLAALGIEVNKSEQVRPFMQRLRFFAELSGCAVVIVHHQNKNSGGKSLYRAVGSIDIPAACRSVFAVGADPNNPEAKAIAHVKANWSSIQATLGYSIRDGLFGWTGESTLTAEDLSQPPAMREERERGANCKEWLAEFLKEGAVDAVTVKDVAKELGYGRRVLEAARDALHVRIERVSYGNKGEGGWKWSMEVEDEPFAEGS